MNTTKVLQYPEQCFSTKWIINKYTFKGELQKSISNHTHVIITLEERIDPGYNIQLKYHSGKEGLSDASGQQGYKFLLDLFGLCVSWLLCLN